jgi:hypothetical protein
MRGGVGNPFGEGSGSEMINGHDSGRKTCRVYLDNKRNDPFFFTDRLEKKVFSYAFFSGKSIPRGL